MGETKNKPQDALRTPKAKKKLGLVVPLPLGMPHDHLIRSEQAPTPPAPPTLTKIDIAEAIPQSGIPYNGIPEKSIPETGTPPPPVRVGKTRTEQIDQSPALDIDPKRGFLQIFNDIVDKVLPKLPPIEQSVLLRLYRESRGRRSETCALGFGYIASTCNISRSRAQQAISSLILSGHIEKISDSQNRQDGSIYRMKLPGVPRTGIPPGGIPVSSIPQYEQGIPPGGSVPPQGIPHSGRNKINNKEHEIHTHTDGVSVASRFSLEECRRYADHLKQSGQGITNPGGYATKIFRSGEADSSVEVFLYPPMQPNITDCPDCSGSGFQYVDRHDMDKGVKPCKHERLGNGVSVEPE